MLSTYKRCLLLLLLDMHHAELVRSYTDLMLDSDTGYGAAAAATSAPCRASALDFQPAVSDRTHQVCVVFCCTQMRSQIIQKLYGSVTKTSKFEQPWFRLRKIMSTIVFRDDFAML